MVRDPVCGMTLAEGDAYAIRRSGDAQVYFCSAPCVQQFDAEPQRYHAPLGNTPGPKASSATPVSHQVQPSVRSVPGRTLLRPIGLGILAVLGLLAFYLGIITLAQGWEHATQQLLDDRWFILAIASGFGTQVGLYTYLRSLHAHMTAGGVAASTGTSTAAMLACCAHHLVDILPIIGVAGAAAFLNTYKIPMLWLSIVMNLIGIVYLLWKMYYARNMTCHTLLRSRSLPS